MIYIFWCISGEEVTVLRLWLRFLPWRNAWPHRGPFTMQCLDSGLKARAVYRQLIRGHTEVVKQNRRSVEARCVGHRDRDSSTRPLDCHSGWNLDDQLRPPRHRKAWADTCDTKRAGSQWPFPFSEFFLFHDITKWSIAAGYRNSVRDGERSSASDGGCLFTWLPAASGRVNSPSEVLGFLPAVCTLSCLCSLPCPLSPSLTQVCLCFACRTQTNSILLLLKLRRATC